MKKIIILLCLLFVISGCYDCEELNNLNIVTAIGFDKEGDEYLVTLEITKSSGSENNTEKDTTLFTAQDEVLAVAMEKAMNNSDKKTYFKHTDAILISEDIARDGISHIIDYLLRDSNISTTYFTVICENSNELLSMKLDNDTISNLIVTTITSHIKSDILNNIDIITSNIINKRKDIALPYVEKIDEDKILIENKAYFDEDKMIDTISNKMYNFLYLDNKNVVFDKDDNVLNIFDKKIKYEVEKDKIVIKISAEGKIVALNEDNDITDKNNYFKVEEIINEKIEEEVKDFLHETLDNGSDLIGFEDLYYKKFRKEVENIDFDVESNIKLSRNGVLLEVIYD